MKEIPPALNKDIDLIPEPEKRTLVRGQSHLIAILLGAIGVLFGVVLSGNKDGKEDLREQLRESKTREKYKDSVINIQSISLTNCFGKQIADAHQSILREQKFNEDQMKSSKRQDSLLTLLNKYR